MEALVPGGREVQHVSLYMPLPAGTKLYAAPQPPEAAPVPQFSRIAQKKLDHLLEAGEAITGYAIENKDGRRGAIDCHGFVYWWQDAAAPQQLANHGIQEQST
jgi:hypothetical protein